MPFGMVSGIGQVMGVLDGVHMSQAEGAGFGVPVHPINWNGVFLYATSNF